MKKILFGTFILSLLHCYSFAQDTIPFINSGDLLKESEELADSGKYKMAIALLDRITRNDTNYIEALYQKAVHLSSDSQFTESIKYCRMALAFPFSEREKEPDLLNQYGLNLDALGDYGAAIAMYDSGMKKYPAYSLYHFNKGIVFWKEEKLEEAEIEFKQTVLINPYQYSAHMDLGLVALQQGKIIPAFISFIGYLLMVPEGKFHTKAINLLDAIAKSTDEILEFKNKRKEEPAEAYQMIEEILLSKIALDQHYKPMIKLDDAISRQIQVLLEKIEMKEGEQDFWMNYYLPYLKSVFTNGKFELLINHLFSAVNIKMIQEYNKKNAKETEAFLQEAATYFDQIRARRESFPAQDTGKTPDYYYENGVLTGRGKIVNDGKMLLGPWEFYYRAGNLKSKGTYNESGKKEGSWKFFYFDGKLDATENYVNGLLEGRQENYFHNGLISSTGNYSKGFLEGDYTEYYRDGALLAVTSYKADKKDGDKREYYSSGNLHFLTHYSADQKNGPYREYYQNGQVSASYLYLNGQLDGDYKSYYESGKVNSEGKYHKDLQDAEWHTYYENGQIKTREKYIEGKSEGLYESFYDNGVLYTKYLNKKGKTMGEVLFYERDGKLSNSEFFDHDIAQWVKFFDKNGKEIHRSEQKDKVLFLEAYTAEGFKLRTVKFNEKGLKEGIEIQYYPNGAKSEESHYADGELNGQFTSYYENGNKKIEVFMKNGKKNGYYRGYYLHGNIENEGWYRDDIALGEWRSYEETGKLQEKSYYQDGDLYGFREEYWVTGKKYLEQHFRGGWMEDMRQFDTSGKEIRYDTFPQGNGKYELIYVTGKPSLETTYAKGLLNGKSVSMFFDGGTQTLQWYKLGLKDSTYADFYTGGSRYNEGYFRFGEKSDTWKSYSEDGKLYSTEEFRFGKNNGKEYRYAENGKYLKEYTYKDGELNGPVRFFTNSGNLICEIQYEENEPISYTYPGKDNKLVAPIPIPADSANLKAFYPGGGPSLELQFINRKMNGTETLYFENGKINIRGRYVYGDKEGNWEEFFENGQLKTEKNYQQDNLHGQYREYYISGKLKEESQFYNGSYVGSCRKFDEAGKLTSHLVYYNGLAVAKKDSSN